MNNGCWLGRSTGCRDGDLRVCILGCFVGCRLVVRLVELLEPNAVDATVDPMATSQLVHREVVQMDYCYGIVRRATHLLNSVTVV